MNKVQKIRNEVERLQNELIQEREKGCGLDVDDACILELQNVLTYIDSLQEEPVSKELEEAARHYLLNEHVSPLNEIFHQADIKTEMQYHEDIENAFKAGFELALKAQKGE